jgi:hypothetical protein
MQYWVNIHHPSEINEDRSIQCRVFVQKRSKRRPSVGDRAFIYETEALSGRTVVLKDEKGRHLVRLGKGAKAVIALVEITSGLKKHPHIWNGTQYVGSFDTKEIRTKEKKVKLSEINDRYLSMGIFKSFNPRMYTGLRVLKTNEIKTLSRLMGVR